MSLQATPIYNIGFNRKYSLVDSNTHLNKFMPINCTFSYEQLLHNFVFKFLFTFHQTNFEKSREFTFGVYGANRILDPGTRLTTLLCALDALTTPTNIDKQHYKTGSKILGQDLPHSSVVRMRSPLQQLSKNNIRKHYLRSWDKAKHTPLCCLMRSPLQQLLPKKISKLDVRSRDKDPLYVLKVR